MPSTKQSDFLSATYTGPQGPQGPQGATGSTGSTGPQGPQGPSSMSDGTAAAPGLPFADNTATGFYRPAANTLGFVTASVERMRIDSSGNLTGATISAPVLSGTATGTYTLGGTPSLAATALTGTLAAARLPAGSVLQVVQGTSTSAMTTTTNITVVSANITPTSASSKILILANVGFEISGDSGHAYANIQRNSSNIFIGDAGGSRPRATWAQNNSGGNGTVAFSMAYVDSPATTSSTTYGINVNSSNGTTVYINRSVRDNDGSAYDGRTVSSIILMEIAA